MTLVSYSVLQNLRRAGLRPTVARIAILQVVQADPLGGVPVDKKVRASREQFMALTTAVGLTLGVTE